MVEAGGGAGLGEVKLGRFWARHELLMRHLDCRQALELLVENQVDLAESALA
jgi:hypothetical protein